MASVRIYLETWYAGTSELIAVLYGLPFAVVLITVESVCHMVQILQRTLLYRPHIRYSMVFCHVCYEYLEKGILQTYRKIYDIYVLFWVTCDFWHVCPILESYSVTEIKLQNIRVMGCLVQSTSTRKYNIVCSLDKRLPNILQPI